MDKFILAVGIIYSIVALGTPFTSPVRTLLDKRTDLLETYDQIIISCIGFIALLFYGAKIWILLQFLDTNPGSIFTILIVYGIMASCAILSIKLETTKGEKIAAMVGRAGFAIDTVVCSCLLFNINIY